MMKLWRKPSFSRTTTRLNNSRDKLISDRKSELSNEGPLFRFYPYQLFMESIHQLAKNYNEIMDSRHHERTSHDTHAPLFF